MELDDFKISKAVLKDVQVDTTTMTYFDGGVFKQPNHVGDFYNHFSSDLEWASVREACREQGMSHRKMVANFRFEVSCFLSMDSLLDFFRLY